MNKKGTRALMPNHLRQIVASKHSAEMTIGTLVVIVLAIIVLVVLALGFGTGWTSLWSKITGYFSPVNVDAVKQACTYACTTQSSYDYCCQIRDVRTEKSGKATSMTCYSNSQIKPADCDLTCEASVCGNLVCEDKNLNNLAGADAKDVCKGADKVDVARKLNPELKVLTTEEVCCKAAT